MPTFFSVSGLCRVTSTSSEFLSHVTSNVPSLISPIHGKQHCPLVIVARGQLVLRMPSLPLFSLSVLFLWLSFCDPCCCLSFSYPRWSEVSERKLFPFKPSYPKPANEMRKDKLTREHRLLLSMQIMEEWKKMVTQEVVRIWGLYNFTRDGKGQGEEGF